MDKTLFSTSELAGWLGVFHTTVRRWIEDGKIKGVRVGRNYKIPAEEAIRLLNYYELPVPEMLKKYELKLQKKAKSPSSYSHHGSILQKLLIVEEIENPAIICRRDAILGANQAFANLVEYSQTDLIGLDIAEVVDGSNKLVDFAQKRLEQPEKVPSHCEAHLKKKNGRQKKFKITVASLNHIQGVFVLVFKVCS